MPLDDATVQESMHHNFFCDCKFESQVSLSETPTNLLRQYDY
jgi:hypothetical protein